MAVRLGRYFWKLFLVNAALMALVLAGCVWGIMSQFDRFRAEELSRHLFAQAAALEVAVYDRFDHSHAGELDAIAKEVGSTERQGVRVTFILTDGTVVGDSRADPAEMDSHGDRPEIRTALATGSGESIRWSHTVAKDMKYVALRVGSESQPLGVVRVSMAAMNIEAQAQRADRLIIGITVTSVLAAILLALALALLWSRRIRRITESAQSISRGDLSARIEVFGNDEVSLLSRSLNEMRERLSTQLDTIARQHRTLDSLVSQLREGVVVADAEGRIVLINSEATHLLQVARGEGGGSLLGQTIEQTVPQRQLRDLLRKTNRESPHTHEPASTHTDDGVDVLDPEVQETELQLTTSTGVRSVLARAFDILLPDVESPGDGAHVGRTLVLTDVTELTRVMKVKADLAANASHELRTPLSVIRAAVETLRSLDWSHDAEAACKFIDVIDKHSSRMEAMIGDLLDLSRLESGSQRLDAIPLAVRTLFEDLHVMFAEALSAKNLRWKTSASGTGLTLTVSPELLRMILRNLIDNAIRFTDPGGDIFLSVRQGGGSFEFEVADTGCGIAPADQARVFERFYQVEQARSGPDRGTGLGLSIVRHAATALNASIELHSTLGQGTRVTVRVPTQAQQPG